MTMTGKKFFVEQNGSVVMAEYNKERNYQLKFDSEIDAETFVQGIHSAQEEIEKMGFLKEAMISLYFMPKEKVFTIIFGIDEKAKKVNPKMNTESETYAFYRDLQQEILRHRKISLDS